MRGIGINPVKDDKPMNRSNKYLFMLLIFLFLSSCSNTNVSATKSTTSQTPVEIIETISTPIYTPTFTIEPTPTKNNLPTMKEHIPAEIIPYQLPGTIPPGTLNGEQYPFAFVLLDEYTGIEHLFITSIDGSEIIHLLASADYGSIGLPIWSPDGDKLALRIDQESVPGKNTWDLFIIDLSLMEIRQITDDPEEEGNPDWSPDGTQLVFTVGGYDHSSIYMIDSDGTHRTLLSERDANDGYPTWSPDGRIIAYETCVAGGNCAVCLLSMSNRDRECQDNYDSITYKLVWSPDSQKIYYQTNTGFYSMEVPLGDTTLLMELPEPDDILDFQLSPDGTRIVFCSQEDIQWYQEDIFLLDIQNQHLMKLTDDGYNDSYPLWDSIGNQIFFISQYRNDSYFGLYWINPESEAITQLINIDLWFSVSIYK